MNVGEKYKELYQAVMEEHEKVFEKQDLTELEQFMELSCKAKRNFSHGCGTGRNFHQRILAMRLMHLGKESHWIWDDTTPGMHEGRSLYCDQWLWTNRPHYLCSGAGKKAGATVAVVTGSPKQICPAAGRFRIVVPAAVFNGTDDRAVPSIQPMGNLFEQHLYMLFDIIIMMLEEKMQVSHEEMEKRHRNIE